MSKSLDQDIFKDHTDYWNVAANIRDIYMSEGTLLNLLDFERVLDELDVYAYRNWALGELVEGPDISKYKVTCIFMWPERLMPDPRAGRRLLPFDCDVVYKKTKIKIPIKIENPSDFAAGTKKAKIIEKPVWLVEITMPKSLMSDIRTGSIELEDEDLELEDLDDAYDQDLDQEQYQAQSQNQQMQPPGMAQPNAQQPAQPFI